MSTLVIGLRSLYQDTFGTTMNPTNEELLWIKTEREKINSKRFIVEDKNDLSKFKTVHIKTNIDTNSVEYLVNDLNDVVNFAKAYNIKIKEYTEDLNGSNTSTIIR